MPLSVAKSDATSHFFCVQICLTVSDDCNRLDSFPPFRSRSAGSEPRLLKTRFAALHCASVQHLTLQTCCAASLTLAACAVLAMRSLFSNGFRVCLTTAEKRSIALEMLVTRCAARLGWSYCVLPCSVVSTIFLSCTSQAPNCPRMQSHNRIKTIAVISRTGLVYCTVMHCAVIGPVADRDPTR